MLNQYPFLFIPSSRENVPRSHLSCFAYCCAPCPALAPPEPAPASVVLTESTEVSMRAAETLLKPITDNPLP